MPENDASEWVRRLTEAMSPMQQMLDEMAEAAQAWMAAAAAAGETGAEHGQDLRKAAERAVQLSGAWIEPLRRLSEEHARFSREMAMWAERHREFAEQMSEWAEAHRAVAEQLSGWSQPLLRYADLMSDSMQSVVAGLFPEARPGERRHRHE